MSNYVRMNELDCVPKELINEVINRFRDAVAIYVYGGSLDCSGGDIDIAVFTNNIPSEMPNLGERVDLQIFRNPLNTLFFVYVIKTGVLVYGEPIHVNVDVAIRNEISRIEERVFIFRNSEDEVMVCKSLKELMFLLAALTCGIDGSSNWYRMSGCLKNLGIEAPSEFKHCLIPPGIDVLRTVGEQILNRVINELRRVLGNIGKT